MGRYVKILGELTPVHAIRHVKKRIRYFLLIIECFTPNNAVYRYKGDISNPAHTMYTILKIEEKSTDYEKNSKIAIFVVFFLYKTII